MYRTYVRTHTNPLKLPKLIKTKIFQKAKGVFPERMNMKKIIITMLLCMTLCAGCGKSDNEDNHMMVQLDKTYHYKIYVHKDTGVMYIRNNEGGICVMVDADGKPLIYEE